LRADPSPLVRAASADGLDGYLTGVSLKALLEATLDEYRLVRVRAAGNLAGIHPDRLQKDTHRKGLEKATAELIKGMNTRGDDYTSHYNLGNFYMERRDFDQALTSYQRSIKLRPDFVPSYVNIAFAHNAKGQNAKAEASFRKALELNPNNIVTQINYAMLLGEMGRLAEAEKAFREALVIDPNSATAAYNLGVILVSDRPKESILWCQKAYKLRPEEVKYGYTYAFFLHQSGNTDEALEVLKDMVNRQMPCADAYALLAAIYLKSGKTEKAIDIYKAARDNKKLSELERNNFGEMIRRTE
jgi:tetratricopeptide (TPR) repeat protein